jgi:hypothetical protein
VRLVRYTITLNVEDASTDELASARAALKDANADLKVKALAGYLAGVAREHVALRLEVERIADPERSQR